MPFATVGVATHPRTWLPLAGLGGVFVATGAAIGRGSLGAVVLVDLGSSVLSVRAALNELTPAELEHLSVADAPLVEGAVAAAVAASTGCGHAEAARAAEEARTVAKL